MLKRILCVVLVTALFAGLSLSPARAGLLESFLAAGGLPPSITLPTGETAHARLDRGQVVYGLPTQVPGNDWKNTQTCWQSENGVNVGRPNQEPRYLGYTLQGDPFSNAWFPDDAPYHIPPSDRRMIENPWRNDLTDAPNDENISDYTWAVIMTALAEYHQVLGFEDPDFPGIKAFYNNPAFRGSFNRETLNRYFKVLAEPRPGATGSVRHWHRRADMGGRIFYDTIPVRWSVNPDFKVKDFPVYHGQEVPVYLDPGTDLARPGETYRGKLRIVGQVDESVLTDPAALAFFGKAEVANLTLPREYDLPFGIAVDGELIRLEGYRPAGPEGEVFNVFMVRAGQGETVVEFDWSLPEGYAKQEVVLAAEVNSTDNLLHEWIWRYRDWSEWHLLNNYTEVTIPTSIVWPDFSVELVPDRFEGQVGQALSGVVRYKLNPDHPQAETAWLRLHHLAGTEHSIALQPVNPADAPDARGHVVFQPGDVKEYRYGFTVQANSEKIIARINPITSHDKDWSNNRAEALIGQPCTDIAVTLTYSPRGDRDVGDRTQLAATVTRARNGPAGPVNVRFKFGHGSWREFTLNQGQSRTFNDVVLHDRAGNITYSAEAWPVGIEDCNPANNRASVTIRVEQKIVPPDEDDQMAVGIVGRS